MNKILSILLDLKRRFKENHNLKTFCLYFALSLIFFNAIFIGYSYDQTSFLSIWEPWATEINNTYLVNPVLSDQTDFYIPVYVNFFHEKSLWNPYLAFGAPLSLMLFNATFYPLNFTFFNPQIAITFSFVFRTTVSGFFMYIFTKKYVNKWGSAFIAGVIYMFSAQHLISIGTAPGYLIPVVPLYFIAISKLKETNCKWRLSFLVVITALCVLSGFPSLVAFLFMIGGGYFLYEFILDRTNAKRRIIEYLFATIFGFSILGFLLIPTAEFFSLIDLGYRESSWSRYFPLINIIYLFNPHFFGNPVFGSWQGDANISENTSYSGILATILLFYSIYSVIKNKSKEMYFFVFAVLGIGVLVFNAFDILKIIKYLPVFSFNPATRLVIILPFFLTVLVSYGLDHILSNPKIIKSMKVRILLIMPIIFGIILSIWGYFFSNVQTIDTYKLGNLLSFILRFINHSVLVLPICVLLILYLLYKKKGSFKMALILTTTISFSIAAVLVSLALLSKNIYNYYDLQNQSVSLWRIYFFFFSLILLILSCLSYFVIISEKLNIQKKVLFITLLVFIDLFSYGGFFNTPTKQETFYPITPEIQYMIDNQKDNERVMALDRAFLQNTNSVYNLPSIQAHAITSDTYRKYMQLLDKKYLSEAGTLDFFRENLNLSSPLLSFFNVKFLVTSTDFDINYTYPLSQTAYNSNLRIKDKVLFDYRAENKFIVDKIEYRMEDIIIESPIELVQTIESNGIIKKQVIPLANNNANSWISYDLGNDKLEISKDNLLSISLELTRDLLPNEDINISCVIGQDRIPSLNIKNSDCLDIAMKIDEKRNKTNFGKVYDGAVDIYENKDPQRQGVYIVDNIIPYKNVDEIFSEIEKNTIGLNNTAFVEDAEFRGSMSQIQKIEGEKYTKIIAYNRDNIVVEAYSNDKALFVIPDAYYPGWKAEVNGIVKDVIKVDGMFRGIEIEPGYSNISIKYKPDSYIYGLTITLSTMGLLLIYQGIIDREKIKIMLDNIKNRGNRKTR